MLALTLALSVLVGFTVGLLGGGGSILMVPLLIYVAGVDTKPAMATSLVVVAVTSIGALLAHARGGRVHWRTGVIFGLTAMIGAYAGGRLAHYVPDRWLLVAFAVTMLGAAVAMIRGRRDSGAVQQPRPSLPFHLVLLQGIGVGLLTGMVGAGGGFLVVPALVLLAGLPMATAVGTSLLVIAMNSIAGFTGYAANVQIDWGLAGKVTALALLGSVVGGTLAGRVRPERLRTAFGVLILCMGVFVLAQAGPSF